MRVLRLLAVLVVVGAAVAWPVRAVAGSMTVYLGATPDGVATPAGPWSNLSYGSGAGGAFGVSVGDGVGAGWSSTASLAFPAGLTATSVVADRFYDAPAMSAVYQPGFATTFENVDTLRVLPGGTVPDHRPGWVLPTTHPSAVLRSRDRDADYAALLADLEVAAQLLG